MKILAIGDVVSPPGMEALRRLLRPAKKRYAADFIIVNGENCSGVGLTPRQAEELFDAGADLITLGNHAFKRPEIAPLLDETDRILRPANLAPQAPGRGWAIYDLGRARLLVMVLQGRCEMAFGPDNPFLAADRILRDNRGQYDLAVCEFHAAATSEKLALGFYLDGRLGAVYGTHTHVPTADARVLPRGTGYITDIGMTGPVDSVLGVQPEQSIAMFRGDLAPRFRPADGPAAMMGVFVKLDPSSGRCADIERFTME